MRRSRIIPNTGAITVAGMALIAGISVKRDDPRKAPLAEIGLSVQSLEPPMRAGLAKFEPAKGCYLGAYIDFDPTLKLSYTDIGGRRHHEPGPFEKIVGKPHATYFFYMGYGSRLPVDWIRRLGSEGKFVHIALEPNDGLDRVRDDSYLHSLATEMRRSGAKIFLRFASEMNGKWTNYHNDPKQYIQKFRLVHDVMKKIAPNVATVWCPFQTPVKYIDRYYPGDAAVDWVGVNVYNVTYHDNNIRDPGFHEDPVQLMSHVYKTYSKRKPVMIGEFAATHFSVVEKTERPEFATSKILRLYRSLPKFPRVKCINYFDSNNIKFVKSRENNDYSVTSHPAVLKAYKTAIASPYFLGRQILSDVERPYARLSEGSSLKGWIGLKAEFDQNLGITQIAIKLDGRIIRLAPSKSSQFAELNAAALPEGSHLLEAEARNEDGELVGYSRVEFISEG